MKLQSFDLQAIEWSRESDRRVLQELRHAVFVREQGVPPEPEQDTLDTSAWHLLARDADRLRAAHWRVHDRPARGTAAGPRSGRRIGLLRGLIVQARARGWMQVGLTALAGAADFYAREGFAPLGAAFVEAGLPHQTMRLDFNEVRERSILTSMLQPLHL